MSEIFAEQLTAVANVVLAVFAVVTAIFAWRALSAQNRQLQDQLAESKREAGERRRAQAVRVFIGTASEQMAVIAHNASEFPVYSAEVRYLRGTGLGAPENLGMIMPGKEKAANTHGERNLLPKAVLTFQDAAGIRWIRMPDGTVAEQVGVSVQDSILAISRGSTNRQLLPPTHPPAAN